MVSVSLLSSWIQRAKLVKGVTSQITSTAAPRRSSRIWHYECSDTLTRLSWDKTTHTIPSIFGTITVFNRGWPSILWLGTILSSPALQKGSAIFLHFIADTTDSGKMTIKNGVRRAT